MNRVIIYAAVILLGLLSKMYGQETFEQKARNIANQIEKITKEEKVILKMQIQQIDNDLQKGAITKEEAVTQKTKLAQEAAQKIEKRSAYEEAKLTLLVKEKIEGRIAVLDTVEKKNLIKINFKKKDSTYVEKRTTSQFVFAAGVNNVVTNGSIAHSDFRYWGSHFYEIGWTFNTRLAKNDNLLHLKYGLSWQINNLRPTNNRMFLENESQTNLQVSSIALDDSRFRNMNIVAPVYLEFDFSKKNKKYFRIQEGFRLGIGGYFGANIESKQILEYKDVNGNCVENKATGGFNVNDFVYGLGAYLGYQGTSLYLKYDLNPIFKENLVSQKNISLGIRFDVN